jgi:hypothetical protein
MQVNAHLVLRPSFNKLSEGIRHDVFYLYIVLLDDNISLASRGGR